MHPLKEENLMRPGKETSMIDKAIDVISAIFLPIVGLLSATGILKGILTVLLTTSVLTADSESYLILNAMADSLFYFLPVFLAVTSAKKFGTNPYLAIVLAGVLLYPSLTSVLESGQTVHLFGLPIRGVTYHSSVIPIILAVWMLSYVERGLNVILPDMISGFLTPLLCILLVGTITLLLFGPAGAFLGDALAAGYAVLYHISPAVAGLLLGAAVQPMVIFGFHWSFVLIGMNNIAVHGSDTVLALMGPAVFAQAGAALAVMIKSRDKSFRTICASAALSALFGITEPAMFGVNLPRKKPMAAVCIGGGIGGALAGISGAQAISFAFPSLAALPVFFGPGFGLYLISCLTGALLAFVITMILSFEVDQVTDEEGNDSPKKDNISRVSMIES